MADTIPQIQAKINEINQAIMDSENMEEIKRSMASMRRPKGRCAYVFSVDYRKISCECGFEYDLKNVNDSNKREKMIIRLHKKKCKMNIGTISNLDPQFTEFVKCKSKKSCTNAYANLK